MSGSGAPMDLAAVEVILQRAAALSNHRHFVIAGSLSILGAVVVAPDDMVMSRDLDLYPKFDPGRGFLEIAEHLSEGSEFAKTHGYYADPITPQLLTLPDGWEQRLMQVPLSGGVVAWFLDPNDAAVSKLVRGNENDVRWARAGIAAGVINPSVVTDRLRSPAIDSAEAISATAALAKCAPPAKAPLVAAPRQRKPR